jgi:hypothetical protein
MRAAIMRATLAACGGFLVGVLWMDLLFDVQALGAPSAAAVASIALYYRRVTTDAYPLNRLIAGVMLLTLAVALHRVVRGSTGRVVAALALLLAALPIGSALLRVFPNAVRLGAQTDPLAGQAALAHAICVDHLLCVASMAACIAVVLCDRRLTPAPLPACRERADPQRDGST